MLTFETPEAAAELSQALADEGDVAGARSALTAALARWPEHPGLWHNLGVVQQQASEWEAAVSSFSRASEFGYPSLLNRGFSHEQLGDVESARNDYLDILRDSPDDPNALINLGTLELRLGDVQTAVDLLLRAAKADPTANWQLADAFLAGGERTAALDALDAAIAAGEVRAYLDRAQLESETDQSAAAADFRAAIAADVRWARREFAVFLDLNDNPEAALQMALEGTDLGDASCFAPLAVIEDRMGNVEAAIEYYRRAIDFGDTGYQSNLDALLARN